MTEIDSSALNGFKVLPLSPFFDLRGRFVKDFSTEYLEMHNIEFTLAENFYTISKKNVFRGLHIQKEPHAARKIVSVIKGKITDFIFDLRPDSKTFGKFVSVEMSEDSNFFLYIPKGLAHGYIAQTENTIVSYKTDIAFCKVCDSGINPSWVLQHEKVQVADLIISARDKSLGTPEEFLAYNVPH